jgi:hypothetical protein
MFNHEAHEDHEVRKASFLGPPGGPRYMSFMLFMVESSATDQP